MLVLAFANLPPVAPADSQRHCSHQALTWTLGDQVTTEHLHAHQFTPGIAMRLAKPKCCGVFNW